LVSFLSNLTDNSPGVILDNRVTAEAAARLTGYNLQHVRRLALAGKLDAIRIGRSWLIKVESLEEYLLEASQAEDRRFGPRTDAQLPISI
jgi:excisionase family DNA binding protein